MYLQVSALALTLYLGVMLSPSAFATETGSPTTGESMGAEKLPDPDLDKLLGGGDKIEPPKLSSEKTVESNDGFGKDRESSSLSRTEPGLVETGTGNEANPVKPVATASVSQVKTLYENGRFKEALDMLATMRSTEMSHYYTALCYQGQGQLQQALAEFDFVLKYAKDPMVKFNSQRAINSINAYAHSRTYKGQGNKFDRGRGSGHHSRR